MAYGPLDLMKRVLRRLKRELRSLLASDRRPEDDTANASPALQSAPPRSADFQPAEAIAQLKQELTSQISFLAHDLAEQSRSANAGLEARLAQLESTLAPIHQLVFEQGNKLSHLDSGLHSRLNDVTNEIFELKNRTGHIDSSIHTRLNDLLYEAFPRMLEQLHEGTTVLAEAIAAAEQETRRHPKVVPAACPEPFETVLDRARNDFPGVFSLWKERLDATGREMLATKVGNAAHPADAYSRLFKLFVERHADGAILDVGCGPYGKPFYLGAFPDSSIAGVEPLLFGEPRDIQVVRGISEFLPWPNSSFDTVISATALDHCLSLERSLDEMTRVLRPGGKILLWLGSEPGARPFEPSAADFQPADQYHLFHFDMKWFEPELERRFHIADRLKFDKTQYSHVFYCLVAH